MWSVWKNILGIQTTVPASANTYWVSTGTVLALSEGIQTQKEFETTYDISCEHLIWAIHNSDIARQKKKPNKIQICRIFADFRKGPTNRHMHAHFAIKNSTAEITGDRTNDDIEKIRKSTNVLYAQPLSNYGMTLICIWSENTTLKFRMTKDESEHLDYGRKIF